MNGSYTLCTYQLKRYLNAMVKDIKAIKKKGYTVVGLVYDFVDFYSIIAIANKENGFTLQQLNELETLWGMFCARLEGYNYTEPLCYEKFNVGTQLNTCCFGDEECLSLDSILQSL
ncbi:hypothetical protein SBFV1_gp37 [Sulfolobales Beppu filamentous phage 1]|uniref:Uncharacterized protein n=1 Tax=Sulfolobales Beppu filamentous phage 1 TaxID=2493122 RepID=A0A3S8NES6_9VIRU|nr:hypothetical protein SBFV1_gp37 [Sulfolobales Beppu filamentous phage 1]